MQVEETVLSIIDAAELDTTSLENVRYFLEQAKQFARPSISQFYVGAIAIGHSGQAYLGANLEFPGQPLYQTVHAEQSALALARLHGETHVNHLIVSEMPCGHCRQFLWELGQPDLPISVLREESLSHHVLSELLPFPFTLSHSSRLLQVEPVSLRLTENKTDAPILQTLALAEKAYVPYTHTYAGATLLLNDGREFYGCTLENAAFNPTLPALQAALIHLVSEGANYFDIAEAIYVEQDQALTSSGVAAWNLIKALSPLAKLSFYTAVTNIQQ